MTKFKVGDRVRAIGYHDGAIGTVIEVEPFDYYIVTLDANQKNRWGSEVEFMERRAHESDELEAIAVNNDYDKAIEDMEAQLAELKAKREAEKLPDEPVRYGAVIKQPCKIPAYRDGDKWYYTYTGSPAYTWKELLESGGTDFIILNGEDD